MTADDAIQMLSQHLITRPVFDALFGGGEFAGRNPVSQVMQAMIGTLDAGGLGAETSTIEDFYDYVQKLIGGIDNAEGRQRVITGLYEEFFRRALPNAVEALGIVYTPVEIVDFINRAVNDLLGRHFDGATLSDEGVHILEPFVGTGTFVSRLISTGLIAPDALERKYAGELHANEITLLAYYIAAMNIENAYQGAQPGAEYRPFDGIVLTDTFQMSEEGNPMDTVFFPRNNDRADRQKGLDIRVIVSNPPWSVGQRSQNDDNQNMAYPTLDASIQSTYAARSKSTNKNSLYDSYIRAIRWASNRLADSPAGGVIMIDFYNEQVRAFAVHAAGRLRSQRLADATTFVDKDPSRFSWESSAFSAAISSRIMAMAHASGSARTPGPTSRYRSERRLGPRIDRGPASQSRCRPPFR